MNFAEYSAITDQTAIYPGKGKESVEAITYAVVGAGDEAGEILGKLKKFLRGDRTMRETRPMILKEVGDALWYLNRIAVECGSSLEEVAKQNAEKLLDRKERGVIRGDGDNR